MPSRHHALSLVAALALLGLSGCAGTGSGTTTDPAVPDWARTLPPEPVALAVFKAKREMVVLRDGVPRPAAAATPSRHPTRRARNPTRAPARA